jgi:DNA segregation ATPase FtsK/SpoIIIE, S-DNA-T family
VAKRAVSDDRKRGAGRSARRRSRSAARTLDLEAVGLVLLALGTSLLLVLLPRFPSGDVGVWLRSYLADPIGWGAWAWPWPFLLLGVLFLLRRSPPRWPRVLLGYLIAAVGGWSLLMLMAPARAGTWGVALRGSLTGAAGVLAYVPAVLLFGLGVELMVGWRPSTILRSVLRAVIRAVRAVSRAAWQARVRARSRAAFRADVARVRRELRELDRDLAALASLYPGSGELDRWRASVQETVASLLDADAAALDGARTDVAAWRGAVGDFARDRARELGHQLRAEGVRPPQAHGEGDERRGEGFEDWARHERAVLDEALAGPGRGALRSVAAAEVVRKALALDLTGLVDRHRRLIRERDLAEAGLADARPRDLAPVAQAHAERVAGLRAVEDDAALLAADAGTLDAWRELLETLARLSDTFPDDDEIEAWDASLAEVLRADGRSELMRHAGWGEALRGAERAARERAAAAATVLASAGANAVDDEDARDDLGQRPSPADAATPLDDLLLDDGSVEVPFGGATPAGAAGADPDAPPWEVTPSAAARAPTRGTGASAPATAAAEPGTDPVGGIPIQLPPLDLLDPPEPPEEDASTLVREQRERVRRIDATLASFKLEGRVVASVRGPTVTRFEVEPAQGEKISRFANLADDLALAMAVASVRIEAPIPGKSVIGLEVPNTVKELIRFREGVESSAFRRSKARLPIVLGKSIDGEILVGDLVRMPHLLIAGSTGSGKSIAVNTLVASLLYRFLPTELRFLMIDPKMVELTPFDGIPHLIRPVVTNPGEAAGVLLGAVSHMERRYKMMSRIGVKNLDQYNAKARNLDLPELPFIIVVIDELADLMITSPKEVESAIMRLAQMARATGMHLILATQRPSVDILTSLIKVNVPARMAFAVSSGFDSRTILDTMGAERLLGRGDMLYHQPGLPKPLRLQGPFMAESEIAAVGDFLRRQYFEDEFVEAYASDFEPALPDDSTANGFIDWNDDKLRVAAELVIAEGEASVSRLQRRLQVGHARAGKLMDSLENLGVVGPHNKSKPRDVLITMDELPNVFGR